MNNKYGIGLSETPAKLHVLFPISLKITIPNEKIIRGNLFEASVTAFCFLQNPENVTLAVTYNSDELSIYNRQNQKWSTQGSGKKF